MPRDAAQLSRSAQLDSRPLGPPAWRRIERWGAGAITGEPLLEQQRGVHARPLGPPFTTQADLIDQARVGLAAVPLPCEPPACLAPEDFSEQSIVVTAIERPWEHRRELALEGRAPVAGTEPAAGVGERGHERRGQQRREHLATGGPRQQFERVQPALTALLLEL
jgi:hypothetical protein